MQNYALGYSLLEDNVTVPQMLLSKTYFYVSKRETLRIFCMTDDSMQPLLCEQDVVIIDTTDSKGIPVGIFALRHKGTFIIRRLQHIIDSNKVKVITENDNYLSCEEDINQLDLVGRVKYFFRGVCSIHGFLFMVKTGVIPR